MFQFVLDNTFTSERIEVNKQLGLFRVKDLAFRKKRKHPRCSNCQGCNHRAGCCKAPPQAEPAQVATEHRTAHQQCNNSDSVRVTTVKRVNTATQTISEIATSEKRVNTATQTISEVATSEERVNTATQIITN